MTDTNRLTDDLPAPMPCTDVARLKPKKATSKIQSDLTAQLLDQAPPAMEEFDGRMYPKGPVAVAVPTLKEAEVQKVGAAGTDAYIPPHVDVEYVPRLEPGNVFNVDMRRNVGIGAGRPDLLHFGLLQSWHGHRHRALRIHASVELLHRRRRLIEELSGEIRLDFRGRFLGLQACDVRARHRCRKVVGQTVRVSHGPAPTNKVDP